MSEWCIINSDIFSLSLACVCALSAGDDAALTVSALHPSHGQNKFSIKQGLRVLCVQATSVLVKVKRAV